MLTRRQVLQATLGAVGCGVALYSWRIEPHWPEWVWRGLPIPNLPAALDGAMLIQLSDIHVGSKSDDDFIVRNFRQAASFTPDIVVITGDFISYHPRVFEQAKRVFAHLPHGRLATLGVLGNHDYGIDWSHPEVASRLVDLLAGCGLTMLRDQVHEVAGLQIAGLDDLYGTGPSSVSAIAALDRNRPSLVLAHNPDLADLPGWDGYHGWILAGHTHGGQCKLPFLRPPLLPVYNTRYVAGQLDLPDGRRMYINRGLGHLIRVRFNVRPEITLFRLSGSGA